jgi:PPK2 family polyphosphate:nucleotide phosphotransferase
MSKPSKRTKTSSNVQVSASVREALRVSPGFQLSRIDAGAVRVGPTDKVAARADIASRLTPAVAELHERLWASSKGGGRDALLVVLQGMDTSGKGGAAKAIDVLLDPLGVNVIGFGRPTKQEIAKGYLWRHQRALPTAGRVTIFDRSHYEAVLVERVAGIVPESVWSARYDEINAWEAALAERSVHVLKIMLHISSAEQRQRFLDRLADPTKHWKYNPADIDVRSQWDQYQAAFQDALTRCSTDVAPWYVVPADRKWHRDWLISSLVMETVRALDLRYPPADFDVAAETERVRRS